jgi:hypothetical protein
MMSFEKSFLFIFLLAATLASPAVFGQESPGGVKGKVRSARNDALAQVTVTAQRDGREVKTTTTDARGDFVLSGLEAGVYSFAFSKNGYNSGIRYNVEVKKNKIRDLGSRLILSVDQGTQIVIRGTVFDENGRSVTGANIDIEKKQSDGSYRKISSTTTSYGLESLARGEFVFSLPPTAEAAEYRLTASTKGVSGSKTIAVSGAAVYRLAINLKAKIESEN